MPWINTSPLVKRYTLEEFWELPDSPDYLKLELIAGVLYMSPRPDQLHSTIVSRVMRLVYECMQKANDTGKLYFPRAAIWRKPNTWVEPDFFYVSADTEAQLEGEYHTTADLVVEVISPETAIYDRNTKADTYAVLGVKELWLVDEFEGLIEVRVLKGDAYDSHVFEREDELISTVLPGLSFKVAEVFGD